MASITRIEVFFENNKAAKEAYNIAVDYIKSCYMDDLKHHGHEALVYERDKIRAYSTNKIMKDNPYCALHYIFLCGMGELNLSRCSDLQRYSMGIGSEDFSDFYLELCFAFAKLMPHEPFNAHSSFEMTVTGDTEDIYVNYDAKFLRFEMRKSYNETAKWMMAPKRVKK